MESFLARDPHSHIVDAFRTVLNVYIPEIIRDYGVIKTMCNNKTYELRICKINIPDDLDMNIDKCFEVSSSFYCNIFGDIVLVDTSNNMENIIHSITTSLCKLPIPSGLYPKYDAYDIASGIFILTG